MNLALLDALSSEHFTSGEALAMRFDCTRAAINKQIDALRQAGILIDARPRHGYRLGYAYHWWRQEDVQRHQALMPDIEMSVLESTDSTNTWLMQRLAQREQGLAMALTDFQQNGRGRRGRAWVAPPGRQLTVSWGIASNVPPQAWLGVALALGAAIARVLHAWKVPVGLKWPNDLLLNGDKLGGILVELEAMMNGASRLVVGLGLNECLTAEERDGLPVPVADLQGWVPASDRLGLLLALSQAVVDCLRNFPENGLAPDLVFWSEHDVLLGKSVRFQLGEDWHEGVALGIRSDGCLRLRTATGEVACHSGEVTVRAT